MPKLMTTPQEEGWSFRKWYDENKVEFNADRRKRYVEDAAYRKRVLEMNRRNRLKRQQIRFAEEKERRKAISLTTGPTWKEVFDENGKPMVTIGALSKLIGRSSQTIRIWEKKGKIPPPEKRVKGKKDEGDRLYTPEQALKIYEMVKDQINTTIAAQEEDITPVQFTVSFPSGETKNITLFSIGALAKSVGRSVLTLEQMERKGVFPQTPLRYPHAHGNYKGHRYYTVGMITAVKHALDNTGGIRIRGEDRKTQFKESILDAWKTEGILGATIMEKVKSKNE